MRFVNGKPPEDDRFRPAEEGWLGLREPSPLAVQIAAIPVAGLIGLLLYTVIVHATAIPLPSAIGAAVLAFLPVIPLHELIHALAGPRFGMTPHTIVGVWPARLLFYAYYERELSRGRFLVSLAGPFILLTVVPLSLCVMLHWNSAALAGIALANGVGAAGDVIGVVIVSSQIPWGATIRNQGWRSYWRPRIEPY